MATLEEVEASISNAGLAYAIRGDKIVTCGCVVRVDSFDRVQIEPEDPTADPGRVKRALTYY